MMDENKPKRFSLGTNMATFCEFIGGGCTPAEVKQAYHDKGSLCGPFGVHVVVRYAYDLGMPTTVTAEVSGYAQDNEDVGRALNLAKTLGMRITLWRTDGRDGHEYWSSVNRQYSRVLAI